MDFGGKIIIFLTLPLPDREAGCRGLADETQSPPPLQDYSWIVYTKVPNGLRKPRDLVLDTPGRLLLVRRGFGPGRHTLDGHGCVIKTSILFLMPI
jgi:hypothetical protein